ncbi:MAG: ATP-binding cassette domain-containing protein [Longimicrobiales bacterium]
MDQVSFQIPHGQIWGLLGPNGSGKTTTLGLLAGTIRPSSGTCRVGQPGGARAVVGVMLTPIGAYPYLTGEENLRLVARRRRVSFDAVEELLATVGLLHARAKRVKSYSMGMVQRLGMAMAMIGDPSILILDEPTSALDPVGAHEVQQLLRGLRQAGKTVLVSSHNLHEVSVVCDHCLVLRAGRLVWEGETQGKGGVLVKPGSDRMRSALEDCEEVISIEPGDDGWFVQLVPGADRAAVSRHLCNSGVYPEHFGWEDRFEEWFLSISSDALASRQHPIG